MPIPATLLDAAETFHTAMLTTLTPEGVLQARPMTVAAREDDIVWFVTSRTSEVARDIDKLERVNATFQSALQFLSVSGDATLVDDPQTIHELWNDSWAAWFPDGPTDKDIVLVRMQCSSGAHWDLRGADGINAAVRMMTAALSQKVTRTVTEALAT